MSEHMETDHSWHLKKEINIGHIVTTLMLAIGIIAWGNNMDQRVTAAEIHIEQIQQIVSQTIKDNRDLRSELLVEIRAMRQDMQDVYSNCQELRGRLNSE